MNVSLAQTKGPPPRRSFLAKLCTELNLEFEDLGDVDVPAPAAIERGPGPKYVKEIVSACENLAPPDQEVVSHRCGQFVALPWATAKLVWALMEAPPWPSAEARASRRDGDDEVPHGRLR